MQPGRLDADKPVLLHFQWQGRQGYVVERHLCTMGSRMMIKVLPCNISHQEASGGQLHRAASQLPFPGSLDVRRLPACLRAGDQHASCSPDAYNQSHAISAYHQCLTAQSSSWKLDRSLPALEEAHRCPLRGERRSHRPDPQLEFTRVPPIPTKRELGAAKQSEPAASAS